MPLTLIGPALIVVGGLVEGASAGAVLDKYRKSSKRRFDEVEAHIQPIKQVYGEAITSPNKELDDLINKIS